MNVLLQLLSECEIAVPMDLLLGNLKDGANHSHALFKVEAPRKDPVTQKAELKTKLTAAAVAQAHPIIVSRVVGLDPYYGCFDRSTFHRV